MLRKTARNLTKGGRRWTFENLERRALLSMTPIDLAPLTAPGQSVAFEAEAFAARSEEGSHTWWNIAAEKPAAGTMFGATTPYLQALNPSGADTTTINYNPAAPFVDYVVQVSQAGQYALDLKAAGRSGGGSLWARFEGAYASNVQGRGVNTSALEIPVGTGGFFNWTDAGVWSLPAGTITLRVSMRESGAALDALRIERISPATPIAPPPPAAAPPFALGTIEAAAFHAQTAGNGHQWSARAADANSVGGLTGSSGGFVQALSTAGADTSASNTNPGAPYVDYLVTVPTAGRYSLDVRVAGRSGSSSLFARVVDTYAVDVQGLGVNTSALLVNAASSGAFEWRDAGVWNVPAGDQTIRVWMRESGVAVDALRLEAEAPVAPPPTDPPPTTTPPPTTPPPTDPPPTTPPPASSPVPVVDAAVILQAEAFQARQTAQGHQWWVVDAERASVGTYFDASGPAADFVQSLSTAGADTPTDINVPNGPYVDYAIDVPAAGRYDLDLRMSGRSGGRSVFARVVDAYAVDTQGMGVNTSALVVPSNTTGFFVWQDAGVWQLPAGRQTIRVWMRESGTSLDALRVTPLAPASPPPTTPPTTPPPTTTPPPAMPVFSTGEIQAEAFQNRQSAQGHQWWTVDAERASVGAFFGATGTAGDFVQSLSTSGAETTTAINAPTGPYVDYIVNVPISGRYELDLRLAGQNGGKSVFVRLLDAYAADVQGWGVNTSALVVEANPNGTFTWQDAGIWHLPAGQQTIRVWMRESGAALDALQLASLAAQTPAATNLALGVFQAEGFHRRATAAGHQWWVADSERSASGVFRGATGPSHDFVQSLNSSGADSSQSSASNAGPYVEYDIEVPQAGRYALRLNMAGKSGGDSLWASFLSGAVADAQGRPLSGGALQITTDTSGNFAWLSSGLWDLPAGKVTLRIGMRASGAALDAISLQPFSLFLPGPTTDGQWLQYRGDGALSGHTGLVGDITDPTIAWSLDVSSQETWAALSFDGSEAALDLPAAGGLDRTALLNELWGIGGPYEYLEGGSRWWLVGRETSGVAELLSADGLPTTYLQALSDRALAGGAAVGNPGGPGVEFSLVVPTAGAYHLQLDVAGLDAQSNSLFAEALGATLVDALGAAVNGRSVLVDAPTSGTFQETPAGVWQLPAGTVTIRVALNEVGAALRGLRLVDQDSQAIATASAADLVRRDPAPTAEQPGQTPTSDSERIGDFLPNTPGLERLTFESLDANTDGVVRLYRRNQGQWAQVWQTGVIPWLGVQPNLITGDFDNDGALDAAFAAWDDLYVLDIATGRVEQKVRFTASGAASGRPYGWLGAEDLNDDGKQEFVILADFENNMSVIGWNSTGKLTKLWDYTIEPDVVNKQSIHQTGFDPLHDVNGDGVLDIVTSIFNETGDNRWHVVVRSGMNGAVLANLPDLYFRGGVDLDGNGPTELFVSQASGAVLPPAAPLSVLEFQAGAMQVRWQQSDADLQLQTVADFPDAVNAGSAGARQRLLVGQLEATGPLTFFTRQVLDEATGQTQVTAWQTGPSGIHAVGTLAGPRLEVLAVSPAPGEPSVLVRASTGLNATAAISAVGFRGEILQARRTGTPLTSVVVGPLAPGAQPTIVVQTPFEQLTAFQVSVGGSPEALWTQPGRGSYVGLNTITGQYGFGNVVLADLLGDGHLATLAGSRGTAGQARLVAIGDDGEELWGHDFDHIPGAPPDWNVGGLTVWMTGHFRSTEFMDVMVSVRRGTMHSDELYLLDGRTGELVWRRDSGYAPGSSYVPRGAGGAQMAVVDWDGDGLDEAINMWPDAFYVVDGNGQNLVQRSFMEDVYGTNRATQQGLAIVADFLANGTQTILHAGSQQVLSLLNQMGQPLWQTSFGAERSLWSPAIGDFDGDGDLDILSSAKNSSTVSAYDARTGAVRWSLALPGVAGPAVSGDIDGDGRDEALFAIGNTLYAVGTTPDGSAGRIEWSRTFGSAVGMPILADVTGQGQLQIVVVAQDGQIYGLA